MSVETIIVVLGIMAYSIGRQISGEPLRAKRLIGLPAALTVIGIIDVARSKGPGIPLPRNWTSRTPGARTSSSRRRTAFSHRPAR